MRLVLAGALGAVLAACSSDGQTAPDPATVPRLYVANANANSITVYAAGGTGNARPTATIAGPSTGLNNPIGIVLDAAGQLYVADFNGITVYAPGATGDAAPVATIAGPNTELAAPVGVALSP